MRIKCYGSPRPQDQVCRIQKGLLELNHELVDAQNADILYCNDAGHYEEAIHDKTNNTNATLILNCLDIPEHLFPNFNIDKIKNQLIQADIVTSISRFVQSQLERYCGVNSKVIYNPIQEVSLTNRNLSARENYPFLWVGRCHDPNKKFGLLLRTFHQYGIPSDRLTVVGSEVPPRGNWTDVVSIEDLDFLYNNSKYVFALSHLEGIHLGSIEGSVCGCVPIVSNQMTTAKEFWPECFQCDPTPESIYNKIQEMENDYTKFQDIAIELGQKYSKQFHYKTIAQNIIDLVK